MFSRGLRTSLCVALLGLCACGAPLEADLRPANPGLPEPEALSGLSTWALDAFLDFNAWRGADAGYVAIFARDGRVVHAVTAGYANIEAERPMELSTRFRMASMTKPLTATAALILVDEGRLGLDDPVSRYIPAAGRVRVATSQNAGADGSVPTRPPVRPLTVRHLLTFQAGIGEEMHDSDLGRIWAAKYIYSGTGSLEDRVNRLLTAPLFEDPGEKWRYGWSADVLARVVEVAAGEPFARFLTRRILEPLGMSKSSFLPPESEWGELATVYTYDDDGELLAVAKPGSDALDWTPGGSGLVATAGDYLRFALMLWNGGSYDGVRILKQETVALMTTPHVTSGVLSDMGIEGLGWGFGIAVVVDSDLTPQPDFDGDVWWSGYYGTSFFVSPESGLAGVVLTQHQPNTWGTFPYGVFIAQAIAIAGL
jgi:CubicO group peptidase (beta-lactamase class C family)